jgi:hypothetical protein
MLYIIGPENQLESEMLNYCSKSKKYKYSHAGHVVAGGIVIEGYERRRFDLVAFIPARIHDDAVV